MKIFFLTIFLLFNDVGESQSLSDLKWTQNIDYSSFKVSKDTTLLSNFFLQKIDRKLHEIALADSNFARGCIGPKKHTRLNWIAEDKDSHIIVSLSFSGKGTSWTQYFFYSGNQIYSVGIRHSTDNVLILKDLMNYIKGSEYDLEKY